MNNIPLPKSNKKEDIDTTIIAIKKHLEEINRLLGIDNSESPDLSGLVTKAELQSSFVNSIELYNMKGATSNAVAESMEWEDISDKVTVTKDVGGSTTSYFTPSIAHCFKCRNLIKLGIRIEPTRDIPAPSGNGNIRFLIQIDGIIPKSVLSTVSTVSYHGARIYPIVIAYNDKISPAGWRVTLRYSQSISQNNLSAYCILAI